MYPYAKFPNARYQTASVVMSMLHGSGGDVNEITGGAAAAVAVVSMLNVE